MSSKFPSSVLLPATLLMISILVGKARAFNFTEGTCPDGDLPYSPFTPYFDFPHDSVQNCWSWSNCVLSQADESRKQQFGATALIMGLIPITLKDIAWPERRIVNVSKPLPVMASILVLALGLVPDDADKTITKEKMAKNNWIAKKLWGHGRWLSFVWLSIFAILMVGSYAGLAIMEIWSKRSSLGCIFPVFVACWYVIALIPGAIHTLFAKFRRHRENKHPENFGEIKPVDPNIQGSGVSAVQGANEDWPVQLSWAIYYIAGTLIWTSIMAVTVVELVIWTGLAFAVTASSKILGFLICFVCESN